MNIQKVNVKLFADGQPPLEKKLIPVFHNWIQNDIVNGLLLDVADYSHVPDGPGVLLIAESANYGFESGADGRYGLVFASKETSDASNADKLLAAITAVVDAAVKLQSEPDLAGSMRLMASSPTATLRLHCRRAGLSPRTSSRVCPQTWAVPGSWR